MVANSKCIILIVCLQIIVTIAQESVWYKREAYDADEPKSLHFESPKYNNFTCPSVSCTSKELRGSFAYFMAATSHSNTFELLVYRVCRYLQTCIRHNHIFITLHHASALDEGPSSDIFRRSAEFLSILGIPHNSWPGQFTSNTKMIHYLESLYGLHDPHKYIFHSDLDEVVDPDILRKAMAEMERGECDAISGAWQDRLTLDGSLNRVELLNDVKLEEQFPLRCSYSVHFMPERTTKKIIVYRSNLRLTSGQHQVWCDYQNPDVKYPLGIKESCRAHVQARVDKSTNENYILRLLPEISERPRICKTVVVIDHYKYIDGVQQHLTNRMNSYKSLGLVWWKQSKEILDDISKNDGKLCTVRCPKYNCFLKELPRVSSINMNGIVKSNQGATQPHKSVIGDGLSKETADMIEKAIGVKVFSTEQETAFVPPKAPKVVEEAYPQDEIISPASNLPAVKDINDVAVTTLYSQREKRKSPKTSIEIIAVPHQVHPILGSKRDKEALIKLDTPPQLLIFGEAIMHTFLEDKELWEPFKHKYKAVNLAVGGERIETLLHRIRFSDWTRLRRGKDADTSPGTPLVVILMIGTNSVGRGESAETISLYLDIIVKECIAKIPGLTHVFVLSILPRAIESLNSSIYEINRLLSSMYSETTLLNGAITFVDLTPLFRAKDGSMKANMYLTDRFHPSHEGCESIIKALTPLLDEVFVNADVSGIQAKKSGIDRDSYSDNTSASKMTLPSTSSRDSLDDQIEAAIKIREVEAGIDMTQQPSRPSSNKDADKNSLFNDLSNSLIDLEKDI